MGGNKHVASEKSTRSGTSEIVKLEFVHSMCSQPDRSIGRHPRKATSKILPRQSTAVPFALSGGIATLRSWLRSLEGRNRNDPRSACVVVCAGSKFRVLFFDAGGCLLHQDNAFGVLSAQYLSLSPKPAMIPPDGAVHFNLLIPPTVMGQSSQAVSSIEWSMRPAKSEGTTLLVANTCLALG